MLLSLEPLWDCPLRLLIDLFKYLVSFTIFMLEEELFLVINLAVSENPSMF